jgi:very-short-patch-repair endonuclease
VTPIITPKTKPSPLSAKRKLHGTSVIEIQLRFELAEFFQTAMSKTARTIRIGDKRYDPDILIPSLNLVIEYDGSIYHADRLQRDIAKTKALAKAGYTVIRLREQPLEKLHRNDIVIPARSSAKFVAEVTLQKIEEVYGITVEGFAEYLLKDKAQATHKADRYIDKLLNVSSSQTRSQTRKTLKSILGRNVVWKDSYESLLSIGTKQLEKRADALTQVFGNKRWRSNPELLAQSVSSINKTAAVLNRHFGDAWKNRPTNLMFQPKTINERVRLADRILGHEKWKTHTVSLIGISSELLKQRSAFLTQMLGSSSWKPQVSLLQMPQETLLEKKQALDRILGEGHWAHAPQLLSWATDTIESGAAQRDKLFGNRSWMSQPTLLTCSSDNLLEKVTILETVGAVSWRDYPHLLTRSANTLQRHADILMDGLGAERAQAVISENNGILGRTDDVLTQLVYRLNQ